MKPTPYLPVFKRSLLLLPSPSFWMASRSFSVKFPLLVTINAGPCSSFHLSEKIFLVSWFCWSRINSTSVAFESSAFWRSSLITSFSVYPWSKFLILFVIFSCWPKLRPILCSRKCFFLSISIPSRLQRTYGISGWVNKKFSVLPIQLTSL